jgi:hypothetical protein
MPTKFTCDGNDINPSLLISGVPEQAKSLVLIMDDPDAPVGIWDHWIVFNIQPDIEQIEEGTEPSGIHGLGTSGNLKYNGPCPASGEHRYFFKLYALDTMLALGEGASKQEVERAMERHVIEQTELVGKYRRG